MSVYPGPIPMATIIPLTLKEGSKRRERLIYLSKLALDQFNKDNIDAKVGLVMLFPSFFFFFFLVSYLLSSIFLYNVCLTFRF